MTKTELAKLVLTEEEFNSSDMALPEMFVTDARNLLNIDVRPYYVWCYAHNKVAGEPINLAERFYQMYQRIPYLLKAAEEKVIDDIFMYAEGIKDDIKYFKALTHEEGSKGKETVFSES